MKLKQEAATIPKPVFAAYIFFVKLLNFFSTFQNGIKILKKKVKMLFECKSEVYGNLRGGRTSTLHTSHFTLLSRNVILHTSDFAVAFSFGDSVLTKANSNRNVFLLIMSARIK